MLRVDKVWGFEQVICNTEHYCSKFLHVKPGMQCSLHYHKMKDETFFVLGGDVFLTVGDNGAELREGERVRIPPGTQHRFASRKGCILVETSTHHDDADVVRLEPSGPISIPELTAT